VLKLQAALRREGAPPALAADIAQVCDLLAAEQRELRGFITRLRPDAGVPAAAEDAELAPELEHLVAALRVQWGMEVTLSVDPPATRVPARLVWHLRQLVREAAANAARHGGARHFSVEAAQHDWVLHLAVSDDGTGLPEHGRFDAAALRARGIGPRSLRERVLTLGGTLLVGSAPSGTRIEMDIPLAGAHAVRGFAGERLAA
jgi:signal transduction histidine kinase